ncbi:MAG: heparinase II/III family protein [Clostridiaceae bacterium]
MFVELGEKFKGEFLLFEPFSINNFHHGDVTQQIFLINEAVKILNSPLPHLNLDDYRQFTATGNRTLFEKKYFDRRKRLGTLVLAEMIEGQNQFTDAILHHIYSICEEITWCLPAHNSYERDHIQHEFPDASRPVLDLFSCETGATLSTVLYLMGERFDQISANIRQTINKNLTERITQPYLSEHFWWMGLDGEPMNNWTIWCTQNILITFFLSESTLESRDHAYQKALKSIDYFLGAYGDDGCCDEGAQYYRHAALCLFQTMDILNQVTNNHFKACFQADKIKNMASYIHKVHVNDGYYINFSDCSPLAGRAGVREYLFAEACGLSSLKRFAALDAKKEEINTLNDSSAFYDRVQTYCHREKLFALNEPVEPAEDIYFPSVGLFVTRSKNFVLAVKAGDNDDSHNHNDTGSVTVYKNGFPLLIDVGVESYTKTTFSPRRYEIWTMQSGYHNLMTFNGRGQMDGPNYRASFVDYKLQDDESYIKMELSEAYPEEAGIKSYKRCVRLDKTSGEEIMIEDTFILENGNQDTYLSLMTAQLPSGSEKSIQFGNLGSVEIDGASKVLFETIPITDEKLLMAWASPLYRIKIYPNKNSLKLILR